VNAIEVKNVSKKFKLYHDKSQTLKERLLFRKRNKKFEELWVLKNISFSLYKGEAVGIVGENGSGKSTMLKLLSRIIFPDSGEVTVKGRVSSLIELGAGFHPDMSGRENIYTNAAIFGLTKKEIDARLQDIIDFSELQAFIDSPVRTYSSGMYMRLAFSVAIHVSADILLIDEILAVGDSAFQQKCFERLLDIKAAGTTIIIVSHSLAQIERICDRSIWLFDGEIKTEGPPTEVHAQYMAYMAKKFDAVSTHRHPEMGAILGVTLKCEGQLREDFRYGENVQVCIDLRLTTELPSLVEVYLQNTQGVLLTAKGADIPPNATQAVLTLYGIPLMQGEYCINILMHTTERIPIDRKESAATLSITWPPPNEPGAAYITSRWDFQTEEE
jgi:ABC-type polysaccharide/polyol phosphate transport system ATPase subunit